MPTNLYGPGDNYHPENSHVVPALIRRFHEAKLNNASQVVIWGTGKPRREFLYVDDLAEACYFMMDLEKAIYQSNTAPMHSHINVGSGRDMEISELANLIGSVVGFHGKIVFDSSKPDGSPRKLINSAKINTIGWHAKTGMEEGLRRAYQDFLTSTRV
jgi:GDP-L-fucose synthase